MSLSPAANTGAMQAAVYFFTFASTGMLSISGCLQELRDYRSLHQHGIVDALQASLHRLKPHLCAGRAMVASRSHLTPQAVLPHVWPAIMETMCAGREPVTPVRASVTPEAPHGVLSHQALRSMRCNHCLVS